MGVNGFNFNLKFFSDLVSPSSVYSVPSFDNYLGYNYIGMTITALF